MKMRMKKIIGGFFCACCLLLSDMGLRADAAEGAPGDLYATAAVLMDADSGRVLYGKNEEAVMAMASTTKIMTCILVLENASPDETLTVSAYAASMPKVKLYIQKGEQYTVRDLLHSLMLESHNDTAVALAEYIGKQHLPEQLREKDTAEYTAEESKAAVAAFAALMNRKAAELGCEDTWFITPNGLDATETLRLADGSTVQKEHCTTARELARILAYCIRQSPKRQEFLDITRAPSYGFSANGRSFSCTNHNAFLTMMERDGRTFVVALLACGWPNNKGYKWTDTRKLMQYGIDNYFYRSFSDQGVAFDESRLKPIPVQNGRTDLLNAIAYTDVVISGRTEGQNGGPGQGEAAAEEGGGGLDGLLLRPDEKIQVRYSMKDSLTAPVEAGSVVGKVEYMVDGILYKQESIVTEDAVEAIDLRWCAEQIWRRFLCTG